MEKGKSEREGKSLKGEVQLVLLRSSAECAMCHIILKGYGVGLEVGVFRGCYLCYECRADEKQLRLLAGFIELGILN